MNKRVILTLVLFGFAFALLVGTFATPTYAAPAKLAESKTGLGEVFKSRDATGTGPTKVQLALTFGATVVMIGVIKYL
ncbi:MAG: hypothetical protein RBU21_13445 [FCB group bacterium]|jgi:hypothetical protein|nr:hypothetical protein [FCB group bacterium]